MHNKLRCVLKLVRNKIQDYEVDLISGEVTKKVEVLNEDDLIFELNLLNVMMIGRNSGSEKRRKELEIKLPDSVMLLTSVQ